MESSHVSHSKHTSFRISAPHHNSQQEPVNSPFTPTNTDNGLVNLDSKLVMTKSSLFQAGFQYYYDTCRLLIEEHQRNYQSIGQVVIKDDATKLPLLFEPRLSAETDRKAKEGWNDEISTVQTWRNVDKLNLMSVSSRGSFGCQTTPSCVHTFANYDGTVRVVQPGVLSQISKEFFGYRDRQSTYPTSQSKSNTINKLDQQTSSAAAHLESRKSSNDLENGVNCSKISSNSSIVLAKLAKIPNRIGPYLCMLCGVEYVDAIQLAGHRCPFILHTEYRCPDCEKVFNCPANLASHRRWHRPKTFSFGRSPGPNSDVYSKCQCPSSEGHFGKPDAEQNSKGFCTNRFASFTDTSIRSYPYSSPVQPKASSVEHDSKRPSMYSSTNFDYPSVVEKVSVSLPWLHVKKNPSFTVDAILGVQIPTPPLPSSKDSPYGHEKHKIPGYSRQTRHKRKTFGFARKQLFRSIVSPKVDFKSKFNNEPGRFCSQCSTTLYSQAAFQEHMFDHLMEHAQLEGYAK